MYFPFAALFEFNPYAAGVGIASVALFVVVGLMVGPEYENMNTFAKGNISKPKDWIRFEVLICMESQVEIRLSVTPRLNSILLKLYFKRI